MAIKKRKLIAICCLVAALAFILGFLIGYFSPRKNDAEDKPFQVYKSLTRLEDTSITDKIVKNVDVKYLDKVLRYLTEKPLLAGTPRQKETADFVYKEFADAGLTAEIVSYDVLLSYPKQGHNNTIQLLESDGRLVYKTNPYEEVFGDELRHPTEVQAFNSYAPSGNVQGELIYANYGTLSDFEKLQAKGINCTGKIVILRYGNIYRGHKVYFAYKFGAVGVILYSDPKDFGPKNKNITAWYPDTWWLPDTGVQRGDIRLSDGDGSTPGYPSTWFSHRLSGEALKEQFPKIPCQPIGARDAYALLGELQGETDEDWQGGFNFTYRIGPKLRNNRKVSMDIRNENKYATIHNVYGKIKGEIEPDRFVIIGNHRDAWVTGSSDPSSGSMVIQEIARMFGKFVKEGWRPRQSILFCSWDGEEHGLIGSFEFVEENIKWINTNVVAYINTDTAIAGNKTIYYRSVPLIENIFMEASKKVRYPTNDAVTMYDSWRGQAEKPEVKPIGAGSDQLAFIAYAGVPSMYPKFVYVDGEEYTKASTPLYHSRYATYHHLKMIDPEYKFTKAITQMLAETVRDLADSLIIPYGLDDYLREINISVAGLMADIGKYNFGASMQTQLDGIKSGFANLSVAVTSFKDRIVNVDKLNPLAVRGINDKLIAFERAFIDSNGLPERPNYKHILYSPSSTNYSGAVDFPGLQDLLYLWTNEKTPETKDRIQHHLATIAHCLYSAAISIS